jgi:hypothetical protein
MSANFLRKMASNLRKWKQFPRNNFIMIQPRCTFPFQFLIFRWIKQARHAEQNPNKLQNYHNMSLKNPSKLVAVSNI